MVILFSDDQDEWSEEYDRFHAPQVMAFERQWHDAGDTLAALTALYMERKAHVQAEVKVPF